MYLTSSRNNHFKSTVELQEAHVHFMDFKISFLFSWQMWTINLETKLKLQHLWFYIVKFDSRPGKHGIRHHVKYGIYCIFAISPQKIKSEIFFSLLSTEIVLENWTVTGQKTHKCEYCNYVAATSSNLKRHQNIHLDVREHHCDQCGQTFRQKIHLERHIKYKHEVRFKKNVLYNTCTCMSWCFFKVEVVAIHST